MGLGWPYVPKNRGSPNSGDCVHILGRVTDDGNPLRGALWSREVGGGEGATNRTNLPRLSSLSRFFDAFLGMWLPSEMVGNERRVWSPAVHPDGGASEADCAQCSPPPRGQGGRQMCWQEPHRGRARPTDPFLPHLVVCSFLGCEPLSHCGEVVRKLCASLPAAERNYSRDCHLFSLAPL